MSNDTNIFYLPTAYLHSIRLCNSISRIISWWWLLVIPTLGYSVIAQQDVQITNILSYLLLLVIVVSYYELGYMFNDTYTTKRESQPSIRLNEQQSNYFYQHVSRIIGIRLVWVIGLLCAYGFLNDWCVNCVITICGVLLLLPIFCIYNRIRALASVLFYPILVSWRYLVFLLPVWGCSHWWTIAALLLLSYPIEISIERYSMPNHRYGLMAILIPNEESKQKFRAYYYLALLSVLFPIWIHYPSFCIPILCLGLYRWIRYAHKIFAKQSATPL